MNSYTAIKDVDHKIDILDHVNQDHPNEVLAIVKSKYSDEEIISAKLFDIFEEGILIHTQARSKDSTNEMFIPFEIEGSLEDQILYLAYAASVKQGVEIGRSSKHFFEITGKQAITKNIIRLTVSSLTPLPEYYAGHAYAFLLKAFKHQPKNTSSKKPEKHWRKKVTEHFMIWLMKHISSKNRQRLLKGANKDVRPYTLRKAWKSTDNSSFSDLGYIDIYTHNDTLGSLWAKSLTVGDTIMSKSESKDNHQHLEDGQALLIADETAYPAIAGILEHWQNPLPPHVILISNKEAEQEYAKLIKFPERTVVHRVICATENQANEALSIIKQLENIDTVWGALEGDAAKTIRYYLRNERNIIGKKNHTRAYWKIKSNRQ
ncbi:siderophore-interacting protein [Marinomonas sp. 5E14-1]|uniref:siderophore-interacting protein n=1 Tax=Marinomonas sp. 5E14-1 TaxID=3153922 RepID=UPI003267B8C6